MRRHALDGGPGTWDTQLHDAVLPPSTGHPEVGDGGWRGGGLGQLLVADP
jgi:hypothetical protein